MKKYDPSEAGEISSKYKNKKPNLKPQKNLNRKKKKEMALSSSLLHLPPSKPFICPPKLNPFPLFKSSFNLSFSNKAKFNVKNGSFATARRASSLVVEEEKEDQEEEFEAVNIAEDVTQVIFLPICPFNSRKIILCF